MQEKCNKYSERLCDKKIKTEITMDCLDGGKLKRVKVEEYKEIDKREMLRALKKMVCIVT